MLTNLCLFSTLNSCRQELPIKPRAGRRVQSGAPGDYWSGIRLILNQAGRQNLQALDLGYSRAGIFPFSHSHILQGRKYRLFVL